MGEIIREGADNLTGGEVNSIPPHLVGTSEAVSTQDLDPRDLRGATTRKGRSLFTSINPGSAASPGSGIRGLKAWTRNNGTFFMFSRKGDNFFHVSAASWTDLGAIGTSNAPFTAAPLNDLLVIAVDGSGARTWDGSAGTSALGGSPPSESKYVTVHVSKIILAGDDANPQKLSLSATNNPADFTTANDAGSITIATGGGDTIQGLASNRLLLLIYMRHSTYYMSGNTVANFKVDKLTDHGLVSPQAHCTSGDVAFFASDDAIYMVAGTRVSDITTLKFRETYKGISDKTKLSLGVVGDLLFVVDYGNSNGYVCAYKTGTWSTWTSQNWFAMDTSIENNIYGGTNASTFQIWQLDTGTLDGTATVTAKWRTPNMSFGWPDAIKNLQAVRVHAKPGIGTVTVTYKKNGVTTGSTTDLSFASTGDHAWDGRHGQSAVRGHYLGMELSWTGTGTVYGWACYAEVTSSRGTVPVEA